MRELYEANFHQPGIYGSGRVWANTWDVFRRAPSRVGRRCRDAVAFVVCFGWGVFFRVFRVTTFFVANPCTSTRLLAARDPDSSQCRLGEGVPTVSQSAHQELTPTYPHQVYRLACSHLRNMACHQLISKETNLIFGPTMNATSTSFFQASRAPVAFVREKERSGRRTEEGRRGMCSDTLNPGGEVRGCCVGCILGMPEVSPFVFIVAASRYLVHGIF